MDENNHHYRLVERAMGYIRENFRQQPALEEIAESIHLSPWHFQRIFTEWAGVSPKKFLQYVSVEHAKRILQEQRTTLFDAAMETGLSGTGRLHDLFISIEGMTPGEFKDGGKNLSITYEIASTPFGQVILASTKKGICFMHFEADAEKAMEALFENFPNASFVKGSDANIQSALRFFRPEDGELRPLKLHLNGTAFQLKVWEALLKIPMGNMTTYSDLAEGIDNPKASRAVGSAVGKNPVAYLIPCHRVIRSSGLIGEYRWGANRKKAMIGWEASKYRQFWNDRLDALSKLLETKKDEL